jgi:hypothetical protein
VLTKKKERVVAVNELNRAEPRAKAPVHLWIVGVLALFWNLIGVFDYLATHLELEFYMSQFTEEQLAYFTSFPTWMVAFWAFGVWGAIAGTIGLLLRKKWAVWAYAISCTGLVFTSIYNFGLSNGAEVMGLGGVIFTVLIWVVAFFLLWYALTQAKRGVLN